MVQVPQLHLNEASRCLILCVRVVLCVRVCLCVCMRLHMCMRLCLCLRLCVCLCLCVCLHVTCLCVLVRIMRTKRCRVVNGKGIAELC